MGNTVWRYLIFGLLTLLFALPVLYLERYVESGPELLRDPLFSALGSDWQVNRNGVGQVTVSEKRLELRAMDDRKAIVVSQKFRRNPAWQLLRLQGDVAVQDIVQGEKGWYLGRLGFVQYAQGKGDYSLPHVVAQLDGTVDVQHYQTVFEIAEKTDALRVMVQLNHCPGTIQVQNLSLRVVHEKVWWSYLQQVASLCFYVFLLYLIYPYFLERKNVALNVCLILIMVGIVVAVSIAPDVKTTFMHHVEEGLQATSASSYVNQAKVGLSARMNIEVTNTKIGHFLLFTLLAVLLCGARPQRSLLLVLADVSLFALTSEALQLFIDGRGALWTDAVLDCSGGLLGCVLWAIGARLFRRGIDYN